MKMFQNARAAVEAEDIEQATEAINALSEVSFPLQVADEWVRELAFLHCNIGWQEMQLEECIQEAAIFFALTRKHIETPIDYYAIFYIRAKAYFFNGEFRKALEDLDLTLQISNSQERIINKNMDDDDIHIHHADGMPYLQLEKFDVSLQISDSQERIGNGDYAEIHTYRGRSYLELEDFPKAIEAFTTVLDQNPDDPNPTTLSLLATAYAENGNYEAAIDTFSMAAEINPEDADIWYNKGCIHLQIENYRDAERDFDKSIDLHNSKWQYYSNRALAKWKLGKRGSAQNDWFLSFYLRGCDPSKVPELNPETISRNNLT